MWLYESVMLLNDRKIEDEQKHTLFHITPHDANIDLRAEELILSVIGETVCFIMFFTYLVITYTINKLTDYIYISSKNLIGVKHQIYIFS